MAKDKTNLEEQKEDLFMLRTRMKLQGVRRKLKTRDKLRKIKSKHTKAMDSLKKLDAPV